MTRDEFLHKYHKYQTFDADEAKREAKKANDIGIAGYEATAVEFPGLGWCLMLTEAVAALRDMGIDVKEG